MNAFPTPVRRERPMSFRAVENQMQYIRQNIDELEKAGAPARLCDAFRDLVWETLAERSTAARQIAARDAGLDELIRTATDAVVFVDVKGSIQRVNPAGERMFGYAEDELVGNNVSMLMPEPHASEHDRYLQRYLETGEGRIIGRVRALTARRRDGREFPIELSVTELSLDPHIRFAAFIRDVSEQRDLQRRLLENERLAAVGTAASMFAHEVANPLNNVYLHVQMLQRLLRRSGIDDDVDRRLGAVVTEVQRLNDLLDEFRTFYRRDQLELDDIDVERLLENTIEFQVRAPLGASIQVLRHYHAGLPPIRGNADKLKQVFINLFKNAVEAMPSGGTLTVRTTRHAGSVSIEIEDTGVGIPARVDVFEPFRTTKAKGTGLGLPIVRQIVTAHGGTISYASDPGVGTTFTVVLPIDGPEAS